MLQLNDHYFLAWVHVSKQKEIIIKDGKSFLDITIDEFKTFQKEYRETMKAFCDRVRYTIKKLNSKKDLKIAPLDL